MSLFELLASKLCILLGMVSAVSVSLLARPTTLCDCILLSVWLRQLHNLLF